MLSLTLKSTRAPKKYEFALMKYYRMRENRYNINWRQIKIDLQFVAIYWLDLGWMLNLELYECSVHHSGMLLELGKTNYLRGRHDKENHALQATIYTNICLRIVPITRITKIYMNIIKDRYIKDNIKHYIYICTFDIQTNWAFTCCEMLSFDIWCGIGIWNWRNRFLGSSHVVVFVKRFTK